MADYRNNLEVIGNIIDPITITIPIYPVKDAYLDQTEAVFPHGIQKYLRVNNSTLEDQSARKIIMAFDIPFLTEAQLQNLVSVKLVLKSSTPERTKRMFELRTHTDNGWIEDGTTWLGQPKDSEDILMKEPLDVGFKNLTFDITEEFLSHNNQPYHFPITISEADTENTTVFKQFHSREAGNDKSPVINITYLYFPDNVDIRQLRGKITVRRNIPNPLDSPIVLPDYPNGKPPTLNGTIFIQNNWINLDLKSKIKLNSFYMDLNPGDLVTGEGADPIPEPSNGDTHGYASDIRGTIIVRRKGGIAVPKGEVTIRRTIPNDIDITPDIKGRVDINFYITKEKNPNDPRWLHSLPFPDFNAKIGVYSYYMDLNPGDPVTGEGADPIPEPT